MIRLRYSDIAVGAKEAFEPAASDKTAFTDLAQLKRNGLQFSNYATIGELNQTLLDGSQTIFPGGDSDANLGLWSNSLSGEDGSFAAPVVLTLTASGLFSSQGFTLTFDEDVGCYATAVNIQWYNGATLLSDRNFTPNSAMYFCSNKVDNFDKAVISFAAINMPHCRLKLRAIDYGRIRIFTGRELAAVSVIQELNPVSAEISIDTLDFTIIGEEDVDYVFAAKQPIELYSDADLLGVFFVESYTRTAARHYSVKGEDYIGLLDRVIFAGGIYAGQNAYALLAAIFDAANIPLVMAPELQSVTISGYIPVCTCREALTQLCFAIGAVADTSLRDHVALYRLSDDVVHGFTLGETMQGQHFADSEKLTEVRLTEHAYSQSAETLEAYKAADSGTGEGIYVEFAEPLHSLAITAGAILESGANYAIINASAGCVLTGGKYLHTARVLSKKNPLVNVGDPQNVVEITDAMLVSAANSAARLDSVYNYYLKRRTVTSSLVLTGQRPGDRVTMETEYLGELDVRIESERYSLYGGAVVAEVTAK